MTLLEQTLEFLTPKNWTRRHHAKRRDGTGCDVLDPEAVCFCLDGALNKLAGKSAYQSMERFPDYQKAHWLLYQATRLLYENFSYSQINDIFGFDAVQKLLLAAIELEKNENLRNDICTRLDKVHT